MESIKSIRESCRKVMETRDLKVSDVATATKIPDSTVRNSLSDNSKSPSLNTFGPICAFLRVSIDDHYGIIRPDVELYADDTYLLNLKKENATQAEVIKQLRAERLDAQDKNRVIRILAAAIVCLSIALLISIVCLAGALSA